MSRPSASAPAVGVPAPLRSPCLARGAACVLVVAVCVGLLVACGSTPKRSGYYQDDGPPARTPADLLSIPDAVPKIEPFHSGAARPYVALGREYVPMTTDVPFRQRGYASWYGRQFHGNRTSTGEIYDMLATTAAHPTLPLPSYARVTNVRSGASVIVRVNDRGPFKSDRIIDLSYAAAARLGIAGPGTGEVEVVRLTFDDIRAGTTATAASGASSAAVPLVALVLAPDPPAVSVPTAPNTTVLSGWAVQLGAFRSPANAQALRERSALLLAQETGLTPDERTPRVERDGDLLRVLVGSWPDRESATEPAQRIAAALGREVSLRWR